MEHRRFSLSTSPTRKGQLPPHNARMTEDSKALPGKIHPLYLTESTELGHTQAIHEMEASVSYLGISEVAVQNISAVPAVQKTGYKSCSEFEFNYRNPEDEIRSLKLDIRILNSEVDRLKIENKCAVSDITRLEKDVELHKKKEKESRAVIAKYKEEVKSLKDIKKIYIAEIENSTKTISDDLMKISHQQRLFNEEVIKFSQRQTNTDQETGISEYEITLSSVGFDSAKLSASSQTQSQLHEIEAQYNFNIKKLTNYNEFLKRESRNHYKQLLSAKEAVGEIIHKNTSLINDVETLMKSFTEVQVKNLKASFNFQGSVNKHQMKDLSSIFQLSSTQMEDRHEDSETKIKIFKGQCELLNEERLRLKAELMDLQKRGYKSYPEARVLQPYFKTLCRMLEPEEILMNISDMLASSSNILPSSPDSADATRSDLELCICKCRSQSLDGKDELKLLKDQLRKITSRIVSLEKAFVDQDVCHEFEWRNSQPESDESTLSAPNKISLLTANERRTLTAMKKKPSDLNKTYLETTETFPDDHDDFDYQTEVRLPRTVGSYRGLFLNQETKQVKMPTEQWTKHSVYKYSDYIYQKFLEGDYEEQNGTVASFTKCSEEEIERSIMKLMETGIESDEREDFMRGEMSKS